MLCKACNIENADDARFCYTCGIDMTTEKRFSTKKTINQRRRLNKYKYHRSSIVDRIFSQKLLLISGSIFFVLAVVYLADPKIFDASTPSVQEEKSDNSVVELKVKEIASKFVCTCGSCGEESLDICSCNRAIQERQMIRDYLLDGEGPNQIIKIISESFGGLKASQSGTKLGIVRQPGNKIDLSAMNKISLVQSDDSSSDVNIATSADLNEILSHFRCPCGQCGMGELKDCECSHPKGATEVKAFVKKKINEGRFTVNQLIDEIDNTFGGKKIVTSMRN